MREVAKHTARPFIFPLSNPTSVAECTAAEAYLWTDGELKMTAPGFITNHKLDKSANRINHVQTGRAIFASGSPFEPVTIHGKTYKPSQCNNMCVCACPFACPACVDWSD